MINVQISPNVFKKRKFKLLKAKAIVANIRSFGGRFLEKDRSCNLWFETGDKKAIERTVRALTDFKRKITVSIVRSYLLDSCNVKMNL